MERRCGPRLALDAAAIIKIDTLTPEIRSRILNASERGLLLALPEARPVGTRIHVKILLDDVEIAVSGIIVHVTDHQAENARLQFRAGIFLTQAGDDWVALCRRLAKLTSTATTQKLPAIR